MSEWASIIFLLKAQGSKRWVQNEFCTDGKQHYAEFPRNVKNCGRYCFIQACPLIRTAVLAECSLLLRLHSDPHQLCCLCLPLQDFEEEREGVWAWDGAFGQRENRYAAATGWAKERAQSVHGCHRDRQSPSTDHPAGRRPGLHFHRLRYRNQMRQLSAIPETELIIIQNGRYVKNK